MDDQAFEEVPESRGHAAFTMVGLEQGGDFARVRQLVVGAVAEADAEAVHRLRGRLAHERHERTGINATREKGAEWHIGHQLSLDGPAQGGAQRLGRVRVTPLAQRHIRRVPVAMHRHFAVAISQEMRRRHLVDTLDHGARRQHVLVGQELIERDRIELARHFRAHE